MARNGRAGPALVRPGSYAALIGAVMVLAATMAVAGAPGPSGAAAPAAALTVTPSNGLVDDQAVSVVLTGASAGSTYVVAECDPTAFTLLARGQTPSDGCDGRHNAVVTVDAGGVAATTLQPQAVLTTALGASDCRSVQCFIAIESVYSTGGPTVLVGDITFSANACSAHHACTPPDDSWDPVLGGPPTRSPSGVTTTAAQPAGPSLAPRAGTGPGRSATPGRPVVFGIAAAPAGDLTAAGAITGPYTAVFPTPVVPVTPLAGEGLLRLALSAPATSWGARVPSSIVVDVTLTDLTRSLAVGTQQFVLFAGASPFTYAGFTGPVTTADAYRVTVSAEPSHDVSGLSWPAGTRVPRADVVDAELEVVGPTNPQYLVTAYAPVMYGRSTSALHDVPLLIDATATPEDGGSTRLSYTVIWSHEDAGTGFVPFLEWGTWGRMTDIEDAISFTVASDGNTSGASYLWGGEPSTGFPDSQGAIQEVDVPFTGSWDGHHPILRDATGNNDFSDAGTTPFRFQLAPVAGPAAGQTRESVMDANPFTYRISGEEVARWYGDVSTDPRSPAPGDARQYATIDLSASGTGVASLAVELQLANGPTWYASDFHSGYPAHGTGHFRTVVKLPAGWQGEPISGVRIQAYPPSSAPSVTVDGLIVLALESDWSLSTETVPPPAVVAGVTAVPPALNVSPVSGTPQVVSTGRSVRNVTAMVTSSLGAPLAGVPVTFSGGAGGPTFDRCHCASPTVLTDGRGLVSSGRATAPSTIGPLLLTASVPDAAAPPVTYDLFVRR
ncbi:MAG TPA: neocarzinostatin apoprotein domain-containing protein [Acidimicrobiales bacterium]|nr:neocarzinostatin apoprotein domain-containing protein [Acidimicrobiales bacterium]